MSVPVSIVVAVARNGVIGRDGDMPWKLSTDLKRFKALTMGKPIIVGRKTLESFGGKPLPGRPHVIITRNRDFSVEGAVTAASVVEGLAAAQRIAAETGAAEVCVIGGGEIYRQIMDAVDILYVTHVETSVPDGDTFFPDIDPALFERCEETAVPAGEKDSYPTRFAVYRRRPATN
nr:dihydrofolate reductase [Rhizobium sp. Q54]